MRRHHINESQGELKGDGLSPLRLDGSRDKSGGEAGLRKQWSKTTQGRPSDLCPLRSDGSHDSQAGRLDHMSSGQKTLKTKLNLKRIYPAQVYSGQMVLMVVRQGDWTAWTVAKETQMSQRTTLGNQGTYVKTGKMTAKKRVNLLLEEVRWWRWCW
jgi:hypothetical protein